MIEKYSKKVREEVLKRDGYIGQLRSYSEERGWYHNPGYCQRPQNCEWLHCHHIRPQRTFTEEEKYEANKMDNLITLPSCQHVGKCPGGRLLPKHSMDIGKPGKWTALTSFVVHRDMQEALMNYRPGNGFQDVFDRRNELVAQGIKYWNTDHDAEMRETAYNNTRNVLNIMRLNDSRNTKTSK